MTGWGGLYLGRAANGRPYGVHPRALVTGDWSLIRAGNGGQIARATGGERRAANGRPYGV